VTISKYGIVIRLVELAFRDERRVPNGCRARSIEEAMDMSDQPKKSYEHIIRERFCKGCSICVAFCPKQVFGLRCGKVYAEHPELCIGCKMCELRCPDFAIEVHERREEPEKGPVDREMDISIPPEAMHD
jgi:2-oxoglutarate ferredoxin oxidoreductase subunit delta